MKRFINEKQKIKLRSYFYDDDNKVKITSKDNELNFNHSSVNENNILINDEFIPTNIKIDINSIYNIDFINNYKVSFGYGVNKLTLEVI